MSLFGKHNGFVTLLHIHTYTHTSTRAKVVVNKAKQCCNREYMKSKVALMHCQLFCRKPVLHKYYYLLMSNVAGINTNRGDISSFFGHRRSEEPSRLLRPCFMGMHVIYH